VVKSDQNSSTPRNAGQASTITGEEEIPGSESLTTDYCLLPTTSTCAEDGEDVVFEVVDDAVGFAVGVVFGGTGGIDVHVADGGEAEVGFAEEHTAEGEDVVAAGVFEAVDHGPGQGPAAGDVVEVIAAGAETDPAGGELVDDGAEVGKAVVGHAEVGEGVGGHGVHPEHADHQVGLEGLDQGRDDLAEGVEKDLVVAHFFEGHVDVVAFAWPFADLGFEAGAGIEGLAALVQRDSKHPVVLIKSVLDPVAVVRVNVNVGEAQAPGQELAGRDHDVVDIAEAFGHGIAGVVVSAHGVEGEVALAVGDELGGAPGGPGPEQVHVEHSGKDGAVLAAQAVFEHLDGEGAGVGLFEALEVGFAVGEEEFGAVEGSRLDQAGVAAVEEVEAADQLVAALGPDRVVGMERAKFVLGELLRV